MKHKNSKIVIFTDLDGTLLDEEYDFQSIAPLISQLIASNVSIVLCSSKTRAEIEFYREKMGITEPFVVENGAAIFIPKSFPPLNCTSTRETADYQIVELGASYSFVRKKLAKLKMMIAAKIAGFGDMTLGEIGKDSGLTLNLAKLAKKREYDEPFRILEGNEREVLSAIKKEGLSCTKGGKYFHLLGNSDKGKAAVVLSELYSQKFGKIATFGVGNSRNDFSMLKVVDTPFLVRKTANKNANYAVWKEILNLATKMIDKEDKNLITQSCSS